MCTVKVNVCINVFIIRIFWVCVCVCAAMCVRSCGTQKKARTPETNVAAYPPGCHGDGEMGKALLELPLKWRAAHHCMPAHIHTQCVHIKTKQA